VWTQYTDRPVKITNCQIGVFAGLCVAPWPCVYRPGAVLPNAWTDDPARMAAAHVPFAHRLAAKPRLALAMIRPGDRSKTRRSPGFGRYGLRRWRDRKALRHAGRAMCLACRATTCSDPGANDRRLPGWRRNRARARPLVMETPVGWRRNQRRKAPRLGPIASWPISTLPI